MLALEVRFERDLACLLRQHHRLRVEKRPELDLGKADLGDAHARDAAEAALDLRGQRQADAAVILRERAGRAPRAVHRGAEHPAVLADGDRADELGSSGQFDGAAEREREVDGEVVRADIEHADAPDEVGDVAGAAGEHLAAVVVGNGDLDRATAIAELLERAAPLGCS